MMKQLSKFGLTKILKSSILFSIVISVSFSQPPAQPSKSWDGPILPVQSGKILLRSQCGKKMTSFPWTKNILILTHGLKEGDSVWAITRSGLFPAKLGDLGCSLGECTANYFSINLEVKKTAPKDVIAVVQQSFMVGLAKPHTPAPVDPAKFLDCTDMLSKIPRPSSTVLYFKFWEIESARKCATFNLGEDLHGPFLQVASKTFDQGEGQADVTEVRVRTRVKERTRLKAAEDVFLDYDTEPLQPVLVFNDPGGIKRVLWWTESGICCPSEVILLVSRVLADGSIQFGKRYSAGGQPCD